MKNKENSSKIYLDIVNQLRHMIEQDGLLPGDKIPSERELSDRLQVGRSSVREALRALELLGLIETKRGEGTFIKNFQDHKLVEILGGFFLQGSEAKRNLTETKNLIELNCLLLAMEHVPKEDLEAFADWAEQADFTDYAFFQRIASLLNNHLMERIWTALHNYENYCTPEKVDSDKIKYLQLAQYLKKRNKREVMDLYMNKIRKMSIFD